MKHLDPDRLAENLEKAARTELSEKRVFGAAYHVYQEGMGSTEKYVGVTALTDGTAVSGDTLFRLASMTKPITAAAALLLQDRGLLSLDRPVETYLPEFRGIRIIDGAGNDLGAPKCLPTLRHILCHTSGIDSDPEKQHMPRRYKETLDATVQYLRGAGLDFEPGSRQLYSGTGAFDVLAKIIETVTGEDYQSFLKREIFDPCGMTDTVFVPGEARWKRLIRLHTHTEGENAETSEPEGCVFGDFPCTHYLGGAGLISSLADYAAFAKMLLMDGCTETKRILSPEAVLQMRTPQVGEDIMPGTERWGLGVRVITDAAYDVLPVGTFGWSGAYGTHFWVDPENRLCAVLLKNSMVYGGAGNVSARDFERLVRDSLEA